MNKIIGQINQQDKTRQGRSLNWLTIQPHSVASGLLAEWFEQETGVKINITTVPYADITDAVVRDVAGGAGKYDIVQYWYPMIGSLVQKGALLEITKWWEQNSEEISPADFIPVFRDNWCLVENRRYGIPFDGDMHLLFYNKSIFGHYALQPPKTWDEYLQMARTITEGEKNSGVYGCGIMAANIPLILIGTFLNRLAGFGGDFFDGIGMPTINSPEAVAALEHLIAEIPYALPSPPSIAFDEMLGPWINGKVGMVEFWADLGKISDNPGQTIAHNWGVTPLPKGPAPKGKVAAPLNAGWSLGISSKSHQPELVMEFLNFYIRPDIVLRICTTQGGLDPVRWSTYELPAFRECVTEELALAAKSAIQSAAISWPTDARWPQLQEILYKNLYLAVTGDSSPQKALNDTQIAWIELLRSA